MRGDSHCVNRCVPSPNWRVRHEDERLEFVIIHGTWMAGDEDALALLRDPEAEVSCHYYITREGEVVQLVEEKNVAWHAGKSQAVNSEGTLVDGLNGWSLGIELANSGPFGDKVPTPEEEANPDWARAEDYTAAQYDSLLRLLTDILRRHDGITKERVLGHDAVSPGRKSDPGPKFDWNYLKAAGLVG